MHWHAVYDWLVTNGNLWKSVIAWFVVAILTWFVGVLPWRRHRKTQDEIADRLNTETPGGLADLVEAVNKLAEKRNDEAHS